MKNKTFNNIIEDYKNFEEVEAIAIGGSSAANTSDKSSDIDIYVFSSVDIPIEKRLELVKKVSSKYEVGGEYFGAGDEYSIEDIGSQADVMFWNKEWFNGVVQNTWDKFYPSNGYSTCFLFTLKNFDILYDKNNWLKNLQSKINSEYPKTLKENIIKRNLMLMYDKPFASYFEQIKKALQRKDIVSVNHRIAAFLASYFDVIFAQNELLHPGEKRLVQYVKSNCNLIPLNFEENIEKLLKQPNALTLEILENMVKELKNII